MFTNVKYPGSACQWKAEVERVESTNTGREEQDAVLGLCSNTKYKIWILKNNCTDLGQSNKRTKWTYNGAMQVCMDKEVEIFFQPCGHISCCQVRKACESHLIKVPLSLSHVNQHSFKILSKWHFHFLKIFFRQDCSTKVKKCPNCRGKITKRLRAFHNN